MNVMNNASKADKLSKLSYFFNIPSQVQGTVKYLFKCGVH